MYYCCIYICVYKSIYITWKKTAIYKFTHVYTVLLLGSYLMRGVVQELVNMRRRGGKLITILQNHLHANGKFMPARAPGIMNYGRTHFICNSLYIEYKVIATEAVFTHPYNWATSLMSQAHPGGRRGCGMKTFLLQVAFTVFLDFVCTSRNWTMLSPEEATKPNIKSSQSLLLNIYYDGFFLIILT